MFNVMWFYQRGTCIVRGDRKCKNNMNYKSTGLVADSSRPWLRGFLGEPL